MWISIALMERHRGFYQSRGSLVKVWPSLAKATLRRMTCSYDYCNEETTGDTSIVILSLKGEESEQSRFFTPLRLLASRQVSLGWHDFIRTRENFIVQTGH